MTPHHTIFLNQWLSDIQLILTLNNKQGETKKDPNIKSK